MRDVADAYTQGAAAWADGPSRIYARLADELIAFSPVALDGRLVLDLGSGTGVGSRAALAAGSRVIAADLAPGMLAVDRERRPPAAAADAVMLPFRTDAFDVVMAPFSLNHLEEPATGVREAGRVGAVLLASTYANDDDHPAKAAVETAMREAGWERPHWYAHLRSAMHAWGTVADATDAVVRGGLEVCDVARREIAFGGLGPSDLVAWRIGMAQHASFFEQLSPEARAHVVERALELLGADSPPLVRRVIFLSAFSDRAR